MNKIIARTNNVNFTSTKNANEAYKVITRFNYLVNLSKFALASSPERGDAISKIKYALENYNVGERERNVLNKVIELLEVE